jgi:hypothetical protein
MGLTYSSVIDAPLGEVFAWHGRHGAITRLLPPWAPLRVEHEAGSLRDGQAELRLPGGLRWVAAHQAAGYDPPHEFDDVLTSQPLATALPWRHSHRFSPAGTRATQVTDVIDTPLPGRVLRPMLIYRHRQLAEDLAAHARSRVTCPEPLTIAVTGSSGLVGTALTALLSTGGHRVIRLVRRLPRHGGERYWRPDDPNEELLAGVDAVIHLAGASIAGRFTPERKREVLQSRIIPTRRLAELAAASARRGPGAGHGGVRAFVSASAIGIYGADRGDEVLTESSPRGEGFLADVVADWEAATDPAAQAGLRTVQVRTGIVQTPRGGMLRLMYPLFSSGLGGRLGTGQQWLAWIGLDDLLDVYLQAVAAGDLSGPVNAVAPAPVRNAVYTATLARVLHRPAVLPVPGFGPRLLLGAEGAREIAQASQRVQPQRLIAAGHHFRYPELAPALRHVLGREADPAPAIRTAVGAE